MDDYYDSHPQRLPRVPITLTGFFGSGYDAVGKSLASLTGLPFVHVAELVAHEEGMGAAQLVLERGRPALAAAESRCLRRALSSTPPGIVVLSESTLLDQNNLKTVLEGSALIYIHEETSTLIDRILERLEQRPGAYLPWISGMSFCQSDVESLLEARRPGYEEAALQLDIGKRNTQSVSVDLIQHFDLWAEGR